MRGLTTLVAAALLGVTATRAGAQGLASPGPLSSAHARIDGLLKCLSCHEAGRELGGRKCLSCHVSLAGRIAANDGYHATATQHGASLRCATCHGEHNGRPFKLVRWEGGSSDRFDHRQAGWTLDGAHARLTCNQCHREALVSDARARADTSLSVQRTFLGLGTACASCHLDEHRGRTARACGDCHSTTAWKPAASFDHARTRFPLAGKHRDVRCGACHAERTAIATGPGGARDSSFIDFSTGRPAAGGCTGCHTSPHRDQSRLGRCDACHTVDGWFLLADSLRTNFDHGRTGFALGGAHSAARCEDCHLSSPAARLDGRVALARANFLRPLARQPMRFARCDDCHAPVHAGEISAARGDCVACHDDARFTPTRYAIAMHDSTAFPLAGAHAAVPCTSCHTPLPGAPAGSGRLHFRLDARSCTACHRDPHAGQFQGRACESCHQVSSWTSVAFDHATTRYPLAGAHARARCSSCHTREAGSTRGPIRFRGLPMTCAAGGCHTNPHGAQFEARTGGGACLACHGDEAWRPAAAFDHARDTAFPLDAPHARAACRSCHRPDASGIVQYRPLPHRCEDCHR